MTSKVAVDAIRLVERMSLDWMVMGRRPSGVCGACLILAARMNNFRRTVTEVVYVVKVTTATIQKRLDEFKLTASSALTVEEFLNNEFLESAHDPPSFYEKQEEFIKSKKTRKRKRRGQPLEEDEEENQEGDVADPNKRQKTATPNPDEALPTVELRLDADGFRIPAQPHSAQPAQPPPSQSEFDDLVDETVENTTDENFEKLITKYGDIEALNPTSDDEDNATSPAGSTTSTPKRDRRRARNPEIIVPEEWSRDEDRIQDEIMEIISDPKTTQLISDPNNKHHAALYAMAEKRAKKHMAKFEATNPSKKISDNEEILDDEFANDPEVQNCLLSAEDIAKKEKVWVNENKNWLRKQQVKAYQKRMAANGPPKRTRNRKKVPKFGELQTSPASSAGEAATNVMKSRALSRKINYQNIEGLFDDMDAPGGGALGSAATSRVTSRAGSSIPDSPSASESVTNDGDSEMGEGGGESFTARTSAPARRSSPAGFVDYDDEGDYVDDDRQDSWKHGNRDRGVEEGEEEEAFDEDEEDYEDVGDGGLEDMEARFGSYGGDDDDE